MEINHTEIIVQDESQTILQYPSNNHHVPTTMTAMITVKEAEKDLMEPLLTIIITIDNQQVRKNEQTIDIYQLTVFHTEIMSTGIFQ